MEIAVGSETPIEETRYPTRVGVNLNQWLLQCEGADGLSFRLYRVQYQDGDNANETPRHHHGFQQIRYAEKGSINFAPNQDILEGEIAYFPRATYYGPQRRDSGIGIFLQYGFGPEMPGGKNSYKIYSESIRKLRELAVVEDGEVIDLDPVTGEERRRESWQVVAEAVTGQEYTIPPERYAAPILMHPEAYAYHQVQPGVDVKCLGRFFDHGGPTGDVSLHIVRLSQGSRYRLSADRAQVAWTLSAGLEIADRSYPELTAFYSPLTEAVEVASQNALELFVVEFPRLR